MEQIKHHSPDNDDADYVPQSDDSTDLPMSTIFKNSKSNIEKSKRKNFKCPYNNCNETFIKNIRLQTHIRVNHTGFTPFQCPLENCSSMFACKSYLNKHLKRHNKIKPKKKYKNEYKCLECSESEKKFRNKIQLKLHQAKQHGHLPFKCNQCDRGFMYRCKLNSHQHRHRGYKCSIENCHFQTDKWTDLRRHLTENHRKLECSICRKNYSSSYNLRIHEETVHNEIVQNNHFNELFKCSIEGCDKSYSRNSSLKNHIRTFHCEPKHCCPKCDNKYRHKKSLTAHLNRVHLPDINHQKPKKNSSKTKKKSLTKSKLDKMLRIKPMIDEKILDETDQEIFNYCDELEPVFENKDVNIDKIIQSNLIQEPIKS